MKMNIDVSSRKCERDVYFAIGEFLASDTGLSCILAVDVFEHDGGAVGAVISWDVHPCRDQINLFRAVWRKATGLSDTTILHDAPGSIVDLPSDHEEIALDVCN
jgi:hypothetical protein